jgi:hypothetical protein
LLGGLIVDRSEGNGRHLVLDDDEGHHYLWLPDPETAQRPAAMLPLDEAFELRLEVASRFYRRLDGRPAGPLPQALQITPFQRMRLILLLHALDFHLVGASPREIAAALVDPEAAALPAREWKSSALRRKANRLITDARALMNGGYRRLLRGA